MNSNLSDYFSHTEITLRRTSDTDIPELVAVINDAYSYQNTAKGEPRTNAAHLRKRVSETDFYTLLHGTLVIGCVYVEPKKSALHFGLLTLRPEYRGRGVANSIITAIEKYAKNHDFASIGLDYMSLAPWLKRYYESYGFSETGEFTQWGKITLIRMQKTTKQVTVETTLTD